MFFTPTPPIAREHPSLWHPKWNRRQERSSIGGYPHIMDCGEMKQNHPVYHGSAFLIVSTLLLSLRGLLLFLPLWHCPLCDAEGWKAAYPQWCPTLALQTKPEQCALCEQTTRSSLAQRWWVLNELQKGGVQGQQPKLPLFR
jgi:hypothetical protein